MILEQGALTGVYTEQQPFAKISRRGKAYPPSVLRSLSPIHAVVQQLAATYQVSNTAILIAWAIAKRTIPIIGITKLHHIKSLKEAVGLRLTANDMHRLANNADLTAISIPGEWE